MRGLDFNHLLLSFVAFSCVKRAAIFCWCSLFSAVVRECWYIYCYIVEASSRWEIPAQGSLFAGVFRCSFRTRLRSLLFAMYNHRQQFFVRFAVTIGFSVMLIVLANSETSIVLSVNSSAFEHENRFRQHCQADGEPILLSIRIVIHFLNIINVVSLLVWA